MKSLLRLLILSLFLSACAPPASLAAPTPTPWPLEVRLDPGRTTTSSSMFRSLQQLVPGSTTLADLYRLAGLPGRRKDLLPDGVALLYPSLWRLYPNIVVLDGASGVVRFVAIENISLQLFNLTNLQHSLGFPLSAGPADAYPDGFERLYFPEAGSAAIIDRRAPAQIRYLQKFPKDVTLEQYRARRGFLQEMQAFAGTEPGLGASAPAPALTAGLAALPPAARRIAFESEDGTPLVGLYYPAGVNPAPLVLLMPPRGGTKQLWSDLGLTEWLRNRGLPNPGAPPGLYPPLPEGLSFAVFAFDYRGYGESGWINNDPQGWLLDGLAAMQVARGLPGVDSARLIAIGASIGADGAIDACGAGCLGALSLSPNNFMNVPYHAAVAALDYEHKPAWCLASVLDLGCPPRAAGAAYRAVVYPGRYHGTDLLRPDLQPGVGRVILDFLLQCLRPTA